MIQYINRILKNLYYCLLRTPIWVIITFFFLIILFCACFTVPKFNDGLAHLIIAKRWFILDHRPIQSDFPNISITVFEPPMWAYIVKQVSIFLGGFNYLFAQLFQSIYYIAVLVLTYLYAIELSKSRRAGKLAVIFLASMPILSVTTILTFYDPLCCFWVLLAFFLLRKKYFLLATLSAAGIYYSKITGILILPAFFLSLSVLIYLKNEKKILKTSMRISLYALMFLVLISYDIYFRLDILLRLFNTPPGTASAPSSKVKIVFLNIASSLPIPDFLQWTGIAVLFLLLVFLIQLALKSKKVLSCLVKKFWIELILIISYTIICIVFHCVTIRYFAIITPIIIVVICANLNYRKIRSILAILIIGSIFQFLLSSLYTYKRGQMDKSTSETLTYLKSIPSKDKIFWQETMLGYYYLDRPVFYNNKYLMDVILDDLNALQKDGISEIVITKRFTYEYEGAYYYNGLPSYVVKNLSKNKSLTKILDNDQYYVYKILGGT